MILDALTDIIKQAKLKGLNNIYIRNKLKEYLQIVVLNYIYNSDYKYLIFTGGSCLRHCYKEFNRLSEDLDFDYIKKPNMRNLQLDIERYIKSGMYYRDVFVSLTNKGRQILLKFPVLQKLGLADASESNFLYLKVEVSRNPSKNFNTTLTMETERGFTYLIKHYDLSTLMAGKICAILTRERFKGKEDKETVKGRDYYDLIWFLKKEVKPNMKRIKDLIDIRSGEELKKRLDMKIEYILSSFRKDIKQDLQAVLEDTNFSDGFVNNYKELYEKYSRNLFSDEEIQLK